MKKVIYLMIALALSTPFLNSCNDEALDPATAQTKDLETNITTADDLNTLLNGAYNKMSASSYYGRDYIIYGEVRSDNAYSNANSNRFVSVGQMSMTDADSYASDTWSQIYSAIANANIVINQDLSTIEGDASLKNYYKGEALAIRALGHFDLLRLYGQQYVGSGGNSALGVPYVTTFKEEDYLFPARNTVQEVYDKAMADLDEALSLMSTSLNDYSAHYINTYGVYAIKARLALYFKDYATAKSACEKIISSGKYSIASSSSFATTFSTDSTSNQIFSIANSSTDNLGNNGLAQIYWGSSYGDIVMLADLYNIYDAADIRKSSDFFSTEVEGAEYRIIGKSPNIASSTDIPIFRYEEVILNYAEALLQSGDASGALTQLNKIPSNRSASTYSSATLSNILLERRKEFAGEGFRFWDLARTGQSLPLVDAMRQAYGIVNYGDYNYAFPIPLAEITANGAVVQNEGY